MNVVLHAANGMDENAEVFADACRIGPHFRLEFRRNGFAPVFGAEDHMNCVLGVCVGHVSHLRRLTSLYTSYPALTRWANLCHAYGAEEARFRRVKPTTNARFWRDKRNET